MSCVAVIVLSEVGIKCEFGEIAAGLCFVWAY